jgi:RHS repeat-associated protein
MFSCTNTDESPLRFTGDELDSETGLHHTDFRQYSSSMGRWLTTELSADRSDLATIRAIVFGHFLGIVN